MVNVMNLPASKYQKGQYPSISYVLSDVLFLWPEKSGFQEMNVFTKSELLVVVWLI